MIKLKGDHDWVSLKYKQLCREVRELHAGKISIGDVIHTLSKLGIAVDDLSRDYLRIKSRLQNAEILSGTHKIKVNPNPLNGDQP